MRNFIRQLREFLRSFPSFQSVSPRPLRLVTPRRKFLTAAERWQLLGERLYAAVGKVVGHDVRDDDYKNLCGDYGRKVAGDFNRVMNRFKKFS